MLDINGINTNGILNQYVKQLQNSITNTSTNTYQNYTLGNITSFSQILSKISENLDSVNTMFQGAFPNCNVEIKAGNCNVTWESWDRNDFPVWQYFKENTSAECLNSWKGTGAEPLQSDPKVQQGLGQIKSGEMVILMSESLQKKMESNPEFAKEVISKVQKWKENYDREDNAIAAAQGHDADLFQMTKSYCIQLDEEGNVEKRVVIGGGIDTRKTDKKLEEDEKDVEKSTTQTTKKKINGWNPYIAMGIDSIGQDKINPYVSIYYNKKK